MTTANGLLTAKRLFVPALVLIAGIGIGAVATALLTEDPGAASSEAYRAAREQQNTGVGQQQPRAMTLEGQFTGPLRDTLIQRWRDPIDGTVCYIYLPVAVAQQAGPSGLVQYGAADIGSISCLP